ncbi:hypothetical protein [Legionella tucsonensis]|uniref:Uncharacterized protein n=1 Tax=Legionella tucsonensis TaxID=40335 RepID=A0A0W0ZU11_9GAMM|nr:hypothetical protein [Legionella tucsonensis]KTD72645.1 hypothetical protein Ltuc_0492 [Legionella tucsonensis]
MGLPQREVPAHVAQEYCHPKRSFEDVVKNLSLLDASNPANLERQLKFYNWNTNSYDDWFPLAAFGDSGLGSSFAILRQGRRPCRGGGGCGVSPRVDLSAIDAIDGARTKDLKQSLERLAVPPSSQAPNPHGS